MKILSFDFETKDPFIKRKFGAGWPYMYHNYRFCDFKVLGMAYYDGHKGEYVTDFARIPEIIRQADIIVAHNAQYDLGCLMALGFEHLVDEYYGKCIDTLMAAKLIDSAKMSYSLDKLSQEYLGQNKTGMEMAQEVWKQEIFPLTKIEEKNGRGELQDNKKSRVKNWTMENLDVVQEANFQLVADYAITDAKLCYDLLQELIQRGHRYYDNPLETFLYWGKLNHVCLDYTKRGIRVDLEKIDQAEQYLQPKITEGLSKIYGTVGFEFNIMSSHQLPKVFETLGLEVGVSATGRPSVTKERLENETHPIAKLILDTKQYMNIKNNFIVKMREIQQFTMHQDETEMRGYGRVHPNFMPMGAKTGRFSCNGPNLQQIPKRNKELGRWCRGIFVAEKWEQWFSLDFSNQEGRLQTHYAAVLGCTGSLELVTKYRQNPNYDLHQEVADMCNVSRTYAKIINLGLSYGMGQGKLCHSLGLPTVKVTNRYGKTYEVAGPEGEDILARYHNIYPYLKETIDTVTYAAKSNRYIRTIGGRAIVNDRARIDGKLVLFPHKAFNQLIQGSAFDQTAKCMIAAYEEGLPVMLTVHDELNLSGNYLQAERLCAIMENTVKLKIPCVTDVEVGPNWWDVKKKEKDDVNFN